MCNILNLIRYKNILLIILSQILLKYVLFSSFRASTTLTTIEFVLLVIATIFIAAAGNIINDVYDVETDLINKPNKVIVGKSISEKTVLNLFIILNAIGIGIGFYLSNRIGKSSFAVLFIIISILLYIYATYLKQTVLIGNIIVSVLVAMSIIIVGLFDLLPVITLQNQQTQLAIFKIVMNYAIFAFMINLLREVIKDIEDIEGDSKSNIKTLPVLIGRKPATIIVFVLSIIPFLAITYYIITYLYEQLLVVGYFLLFIIAPLLYFTVSIPWAKSKTQLHHLSAILKLVMLFGILSLLLYPLILS